MTFVTQPGGQSVCTVTSDELVLLWLLMAPQYRVFPFSSVIGTPFHSWAHDLLNKDYISLPFCSSKKCLKEEGLWVAFFTSFLLEDTYNACGSAAILDNEVNWGPDAYPWRTKSQNLGPWYHDLLSWLWDRYFLEMEKFSVWIKPLFSENFPQPCFPS
jgi:hypothetical protein